jgi:hypothetical protein
MDQRTAIGCDGCRSDLRNNASFFTRITKRLSGKKTEKREG